MEVTNSRTRLSVDLDKKTLQEIAMVAARLSLEAGRRVSTREAILRALMEVYPELEATLKRELGE